MQRRGAWRIKMRLRRCESRNGLFCFLSFPDRASWPAGVVNCSKPLPANATHCDQDAGSPERRRDAPKPFNCSPHHVTSSKKSSTVIAIVLPLNRVPFMPGIFFLPPTARAKGGDAKIHLAHWKSIVWILLFYYLPGMNGPRTAAEHRNHCRRESNDTQRVTAITPPDHPGYLRHPQPSAKSTSAIVRATQSA
jgi:hypothetical protein